MKFIAAAFVALGTIAATSTLAEARDYHPHHPVIHRHHGPLIVLGHHPHHVVYHARPHVRHAHQ